MSPRRGDGTILDQPELSQWDVVRAARGTSGPSQRLKPLEPHLFECAVGGALLRRPPAEAARFGGFSTARTTGPLKPRLHPRSAPGELKGLGPKGRTSVKAPQTSSESNECTEGDNINNLHIPGIRNATKELLLGSIKTSASSIKMPAKTI